MHSALNLRNTNVYNSRANMSGTPRFSISKQKSPKSKPNNQSLIKNVYFCHYKNAMYMGGINTFKKNGKGVLLHDNGTTMISSYYNDMLHGDNIIILPNTSIASIQYSKDRMVQAVYKSKQKLLFLKFKNGVPDAGSILVDYINKTIIYANFKNGQVIKKIEQEDESKLLNVFELKNLNTLISKKHVNYINLDIQNTGDINIIRNSNKISIGFSKNGTLNGLGFIMIHRLNDKIEELDDYSLQLLERGYYKNSQLNGLGERRFKNGNIYTGQFKSDVFEGQGILKNYVKNNWISGRFERGNLVELMQYNNSGDPKFGYRILQAIHKKKTSWVNDEINIPIQSFFEREIHKILTFVKTGHQTSLDLRRREVLRRIQDNFVTGITKEDVIQKMELQTNLKLPKFMETPSKALINDSFKQNISKKSLTQEKTPIDQFLDLKTSRRSRILHGQIQAQNSYLREQENFPKQSNSKRDILIEQNKSSILPEIKKQSYPDPYFNKLFKSKTPQKSKQKSISPVKNKSSIKSKSPVSTRKPTEHDVLETLYRRSVKKTLL